jgi:hypothetical protein
VPRSWLRLSWLPAAEGDILLHLWLPDSEEEVPELAGFFQMGRVRGVVEPHQALARRLQGAGVPLGRSAGRYLVAAALHHDDGHVEAGHGAGQVQGGQLGQQRGLGGADTADGPDDVRGRVIG